ncbi:TraB/GumN family protein [Gammaproteobacteria bacterium]
MLVALRVDTLSVDLLRQLLLIFCFLPVSLGLVTGSAVAAERGLLWRVETPGVAPGFLFGTIHSEDPKVTTLAEPVVHALEASNELLLELVPSESELRTVQQAMFLPRNDSLQRIIGAADFNRTTSALMVHGFPIKLVGHLKPWAAAVILGLPPPRTGLILDLILYAQAVKRGMTVAGLETAREQSIVFDGLKVAEQVELLRETLGHLVHQDQLFTELYDAYLSRDLEQLAALNETYSQLSNAKLGRKLMDRLLEQRNHRMVGRIEPYLRRGGVFTAVGALHLAGKTGLIEQLRARGYQITAVY